MIEFSPALSHEGKIERCICCESMSVVRRLNFWRPDYNGGNSVVLCLNCRRQLFRLLKADSDVAFYECERKR